MLASKATCSVLELCDHCETCDFIPFASYLGLGVLEVFLSRGGDEIASIDI